MYKKFDKTLFLNLNTLGGGRIQIIEKGWEIELVCRNCGSILKVGSSDLSIKWRPLLGFIKWVRIGVIEFTCSNCQVEQVFPGHPIYTNIPRADLSGLREKYPVPI